ncbi:hypothetical protein FRB99_008824 [Tulasnella sp. 403]|nr:hypothetical protein FRB99_008824 [Tulasnella sp. 403]
MIIDKNQDVPINLITPEDQPPSYNSVAGDASSSSASRPTHNPRAGSSGSPYFPLDVKTRSESPTLSGPSSSGSRGNSKAEPASPVARSPAGWLGNFLGTPQAKKDTEVKNTVLGLVQAVIKQGDSANAVAIIQSCSDACRARGLSFESIVQEPSIQDHTPLYWVIVKGVYSKSEDASPQTSTDGLSVLFDLLVSFPLTLATYEDAVQACLLTSSHETFVRLKRYNPSPQVRMLEDDTPDTEDTVTVVNGEDVEAVLNGAFRAEISIKNFQKRMRVFKEVSVEFIARGMCMYPFQFDVNI